MAKVVLVTVYAKDKPDKKKKMYALIDDQSNRSLAKPEFSMNLRKTMQR